MESEAFWKRVSFEKRLLFPCVQATLIKACFERVLKLFQSMFKNHVQNFLIFREYAGPLGKGFPSVLPWRYLGKVCR